MEFETQFIDWADRSLSENISEDVKAFSFNLFEITGGFGVELIGARYFDEANWDWAAYEVFEPSQRQLLIPVEYSGRDWETCLDKMLSLVDKYLSEDSKGSRILKLKDAVGVGFVDGDLYIVYKS